MFMDITVLLLQTVSYVTEMAKENCIVEYGSGKVTRMAKPEHLWPNLIGIQMVT